MAGYKKDALRMFLNALDKFQCSIYEGVTLQRK